MIRLIDVDRKARHLAFEHDGVRLDWHGPAALAIIALVEHMAGVQPPDWIEATGAALGKMGISVTTEP